VPSETQQKDDYGKRSPFIEPAEPAFGYESRCSVRVNYHKARAGLPVRCRLHWSHIGPHVFVYRTVKWSAYADHAHYPSTQTIGKVYCSHTGKTMDAHEWCKETGGQATARHIQERMSTVGLGRPFL